jgi:hypothetical protein
MMPAAPGVMPSGAKTVDSGGGFRRPKAARVRRKGCGPGVRDALRKGFPMVAANRSLLRMVRRLAIRDELLAMRLRGRLVAPTTVPPSGGHVATRPTKR